MKSLSSIILPVLAVLIASTATAQELSIGSETIGPGGTATVDLDISGLTPGISALATYDINVGFNSSVVDFGSATFGDPVLGSDQLDPEGYGTLNAVTAASGAVELFELSLDDPPALLASQPASFTLATVTFDGVGTGNSVLTLSINALGDQNGNSLPAILQNGSITVTGGGGGATQAPEIDTAATISALTLLLGSLLVRNGGRRVG